MGSATFLTWDFISRSLDPGFVLREGIFSDELICSHSYSIR
jgi:hypothetical protein